MGARLRARRHQSPAPSPGGHLSGTLASRLTTKLSTQLALVHPSTQGKYSSTAILKATDEYSQTVGEVAARCLSLLPLWRRWRGRSPCRMRGFASAETDPSPVCDASHP